MLNHCSMFVICWALAWDYHHIGSNFWKFYLIKIGFPLHELIFLVKVFRLFRVEWIFLGVQSVDTEGRCTTSYLFVMPCWLCLRFGCGVLQWMCFKQLFFSPGSSVKKTVWASVNHCPRLNLHLLKWGLLVATLNPTNVRFELSNLDLVQARDIYNILK